MVHLFDLFFVLTHCKLFELSWISDDIIDSLLLQMFVDVRLIIVDTVSNYLVDMIIVPVMDSSLIEDIVLQVFWPFLRRNSNFC